MGYENLFAAVLLSFVIERVLAVIYDITGANEKLKFNGKWTEANAPTFTGASSKGVIAAGLAIAIAWLGDVDILNEILRIAKDETDAAKTYIRNPFGYIITGIFIAGGSQASVKLFQDVLGFSKANRDLIKSAHSEEVAAQAEKAKRDRTQAELEVQRAKNALTVASGEEKIAARRAATSLQIAEIENAKNLANARADAGQTVDPKFLTMPHDGYLKDAMDNWDDFVQLRAELLTRAAG